MKNKKVVVVTAGMLTGVALAAIALSNTPKKREKRLSDRQRLQTRRDCDRGGAC